MNTVLRFIPIEIIFAFLVNWLSSTIKNPSSARSQSLRPVLLQLRVLVEDLLAKLDVTPSK